MHTFYHRSRILTCLRLLSCLLVLLGCGTGRILAEQAEVPRDPKWAGAARKPGREGEKAASRDWRGAPAADSYAEATAHAPRFDDGKLWGEWVERTAFRKETWPETRLLVWASAGETKREADQQDPENWLENGEPATRAIDEYTDLLLPDSEHRYYVRWRKDRTVHVRHLTLGRNAHFRGCVFVHGNVWIKKGARGPLAIRSLRGAKHTFIRNDNRKNPIMLTDHLHFHRRKGASTEFLGRFMTTDDLNLLSGRMILARDSAFTPGDRSVQGIYPDADLVLLSGSAFHKRGNQHWGTDMVVAGEFLAGTPERPLTKDCRLGLSYKNKGYVSEMVRAHKGRTKPTDRGLVVLGEGDLRVHSADPEKARLVIGWHGLKLKSGLGDREEPPDVKAIPHKIDLLLLGDVRLNGVVFEDILAGGILLPDPAERHRWRNVFYGEGNEGKPEALYRKYEGDTDYRLGG